MIPARSHDVLRERRASASARKARASGFVPRPATGACADPAPEVSKDSLSVFVAMTLVNPTNARGHWGANAKRAKRQREAVALALWCARHDPRGPWRAWLGVTPETPKVITFTAHVGRRMDSDGLQASLKAARDSLQDCGLVLTDGPGEPHEWIYHQVVDGRRGVDVTVRLRHAG